MSERIKGAKQQKMDCKEYYVDCSFILGSIAEIERLWYSARVITSDNRKNITPALLEALLFLKTNVSYWGLSLVSRALNSDRTNSAKNRLQLDIVKLTNLL